MNFILDNKQLIANQLMRMGVTLALGGNIGGKKLTL
jgi:hypothetical protein